MWQPGEPRVETRIKEELIGQLLFDSSSPGLISFVWGFVVLLQLYLLCQGVI